MKLEDENAGDTWQYQIGIRQETSGSRQLYLTHERVWKNGKNQIKRPDPDDEKDELRLSQTHLEQINSNQKFRPVAEFFQEVLYLHLVPQLLRHSEYFTGSSMPSDPFGKSFLERVAKASHPPLNRMTSIPPPSSPPDQTMNPLDPSRLKTTNSNAVDTPWLEVP